MLEVRSSLLVRVRGLTATAMGLLKLGTPLRWEARNAGGGAFAALIAAPRRTCWSTATISGGKACCNSSRRIDAWSIWRTIPSSMATQLVSKSVSDLGSRSWNTPYLNWMDRRPSISKVSLSGGAAASPRPRSDATFATAGAGGELRNWKMLGER